MVRIKQEEKDNYGKGIDEVLEWRIRKGVREEWLPKKSSQGKQESGRLNLLCKDLRKGGKDKNFECRKVLSERRQMMGN